MHNKGVKIKQHDITDCGAACLASICAHYGLRYPIQSGSIRIGSYDIYGC